MTTTFDDLLVAFETHSVERLRTLLDAGFDVRSPVQGKTPVNWFIEMYFRSDRFPDCLRLLLERGATLDDPKLAPILLDDPQALETAVRRDRSLLAHRTSLVCAFTPLVGASLLHVAAEYGHLAVAEKLLELGAEVDARAATDEFGLNGHTPLFHTVNSNANRTAPVMRLLLAAGAQPDLRLPGITWGKGFDWETTCFDVTPVSYAQLGLLPQMHRKEQDCYDNVRALLEACGRAVPPLGNVPNRYLGG
ncbi:MAG: ankyrin repeat domain-containing protein [Thermoanaerobaculia bacterium]|nr:ankyrin repeat domain-containing protein [Thermoanaerobaculia bacterium]